MSTIRGLSFDIGVDSARPMKHSIHDVSTSCQKVWHANVFPDPNPVTQPMGLTHRTKYPTGNTCTYLVKLGQNRLESQIPYSLLKIITQTKNSESYQIPSTTRSNTARGSMAVRTRTSITTWVLTYWITATHWY
jgi:hypothetical protein